MSAVAEMERWFKVQQFLFLEADLLDRRQFRAWMDLLDPAVEYWVPLGWEQESPRDHVSLFFETYDLIQMRVERLEHPATVAQWPPSRTSHHLSNVRVSEGEGGVLLADSLLLYVEHRRDDQRVFSGRCRHTLKPHGESFRILAKRVDILNADQDSGHIRLAVPF